MNDDSSLGPSPNSSGRGEEGQGVRVKRPCSHRRTRANASSWGTRGTCCTGWNHQEAEAKAKKKVSSTLGGQALRSRESVSRCWKLTLSSAWPVPIDRHQDAEPLRLAFALLAVSRPDSDLLHLDVSRKKAAAPKTPTKPDLEEEQRILLTSYAQFFCNLCAAIGLECCVFMLPK